MGYINMRDEKVSNSKYYMLRCIITMAHADGLVCDQERAYISALTSRMNLSPEQRLQIDKDLIEQQDFANLFRQINDPKFRGQILYFARILAYKDGVLDPGEQELLNVIHKHATDGLDIEAIKDDATNATKANMLVHDIELDQHRPRKHGHSIPFIQWFDEVLLSLNIDLMRE